MSIYIPDRPALVPAKGMYGPGAGAMMTQPMAPWWDGQQNKPHAMMRAAAGFWKSDPWVRAAERVISGQFSIVDWHLEDDKDEEINDEYPDQRYQFVRSLIEQPQARLDREDRQINASTRRELWAITSRHMGVCGSAFWFLDRLETVARTPMAILYIAPWRMTPSFTKQGNLIGWVLDWNEDSQSGTPLQLDEVIQFNLEPPDEGAFPPGLIESAMSLIRLDALAIGHAGSVLTSGGRLAGIVSAKDAVSALPDDKFQQLVRDFRTINELPDAAKRTNIVQGPIDFNRTSATPQELQLIDLMAAMRDHILAVEGTPYSQLGGSVGSGLNSGDVRKYDKQALWENAIEPRLIPFKEGIQFQLLDRYKLLGISPELEIIPPSFDDEAPKYDLLAKAERTPLRNWERREIIGKEPFGPEILGDSGAPLDDEIWIGGDRVGVASEGFTPRRPRPIGPGEDLDEPDVLDEDAQAKAAEEDHYYGAWVGGRAASGGHPGGGRARTVVATTEWPVAKLGAPYPVKEPHATTGWSEPVSKVTLKSGAKAEIQSGGDAVPGGYNGYYVAHDPSSGQKMGYLDYQTARGDKTVLIGMVEVESAFRSSGVSDALMARLIAELEPGQIVDPGMMTESGFAWWNRVKQYVPHKPAPSAKALAIAPLTAIRHRVEREHTPELKRSIADFLADQRRDIALRLRTNPEHVAKKPKDHDRWFNKAHWDRALKGILSRPLTAMAQNVNRQIGRKLDTQTNAPASVVDRALERGGARITAINERTREAVMQFIVAGLREGLSTVAIADAIETGVTLDNGQPAFDEYRAELIARTELMDAYNASSIASYEDAGITSVEAIDGDEDDVCAARNGRTFSTSEAMAIEDHPNGTLDWVPVLEPVKGASIAELIEPKPDLMATLVGVLKAREPVNVQVVQGETRQTRTVIDRDASGRVIGSHEEDDEPRRSRTVIDRDMDGRVFGTHEEYIGGS